MRELLRQRDFTIVGYYQTILEGEGILTFVRNRDLTNVITDFPIPEFYPALCVMDDADYDRAVMILKEHLAPKAAAPPSDWVCSCGEENPGTFEVCWACGQARPTGNE